MEKVIGNCSKHPGHNFVNCPLCEIAEQAAKNKVVPGFHAVQYANYFNIQPSPFYGDNNILDAEDVGEDQAEMYAELLAKLLTEHFYPSKPNPDEDGITELNNWRDNATHLGAELLKADRQIKRLEAYIEKHYNPQEKSFGKKDPPLDGTWDNEDIGEYRGGNNDT